MHFDKFDEIYKTNAITMSGIGAGTLESEGLTIVEI